MRYLGAIVLISLSVPTKAEVVSASTNGFEIRHAVNLVANPDVVLPAFARLPQWWSAEHTYSGDAANLSLSMTPGGCFCEQFPDGGGIEHMRVTYVDPGKRVLLTGSLGPLLHEATTGVMDLQVKSSAGGSRMVLTYKVAGFANGGGKSLARVVDQVLAGQLKRFRTYVTALPRAS